MTVESFTALWQHQVDHNTDRDPIYASQLNAILNGLEDPAAPTTPLDDVVAQPPAGRGYDRYDAAALYEVALNLNLGWSVIALLSSDDNTTGTAPGQSEWAPPLPFTTSPTGDAHDHLRWTEEITLSHAALSNRPLTVTYAPGEVPLITGPITPAATIWHLRQSGGLARRPAGHRSITLILSTRAQPPALVPPPRFLAGGPVAA
jgi:hypothetical protein